MRTTSDGLKFKIHVAKVEYRILEKAKGIAECVARATYVRDGLPEINVDSDLAAETAKSIERLIKIISVIEDATAREKAAKKAKKAKPAEAAVASAAAAK